jgi:hypothetical protein
MKSINENISSNENRHLIHIPTSKCIGMQVENIKKQKLNEIEKAIHHNSKTKI